MGVDGLQITAFQRQGDNIRLKLKSQLAALPAPYDQPYAVELRIVGLSAGQYNLQINDQSPQRADAARLARYSLMISADGKRWLPQP